MVHQVFVSLQRFAIFDKKPNSWNILLSKALGIEVDDTIVVNELDSAGDPTGNNKIGTVRFLNSTKIVEYLGDEQLYYINKQFGVGTRQIGISFVVG